ncbi:MAG: amino acid permease [Alicyclobacillus sp.]|nr:amino acid permease [Alicyclobacillus sp.]
MARLHDGHKKATVKQAGVRWSGGLSQSSATTGAGQPTPSQARRKQAGELSTASLTLMGVGGIIGAGFFLGSGQPIHLAGPGVLLAFFAGALLTAQVVGALATMAVHHPEVGGYELYPQLFLGRWAGFVQGWTYYLTSILTIASEAVAMALFVRVWWPALPLHVAATVFAGVIIIINALGMRSFARIETVMSAVKIAALLTFIAFAAGAWAGWWHHVVTAPASRPQGVAGTPGSTGGWFPTGAGGVLRSMLIVVFAYAGIGVFASAAGRVRSPRMIDRAAWWTVGLLAGLYMVSVGLLLRLVPWQQVSTQTSPFVYALQQAGTGWLAQTLNGAILVAAFSVMAGALYSADETLAGLAGDGHAPAWLGRRTAAGTPRRALLVSTCAILAALWLSAWLPANVYNVLISASSFFTFLNWFILLCAFLAWRRRAVPGAFVSRLAFGQPISTYLAMAGIVALAAFAATDHDQRVGLYAAAAMTAVVVMAYAGLRRVRRQGEPAERRPEE